MEERLFKYLLLNFRVEPMKIIDFNVTKHGIFEGKYRIGDFRRYKNDIDFDINIDVSKVKQVVCKGFERSIPNDLALFIFNYDNFFGDFTFSLKFKDKINFEAVSILIDSYEEITEKFKLIKTRKDDLSFLIKVHVSDLFDVDGVITDVFKPLLNIISIIKNNIDKIDITDKDIYIGRNLSDAICVYYLSKDSNVYIKIKE